MHKQPRQQHHSRTTCVLATATLACLSLLLLFIGHTYFALPRSLDPGQRLLATNQAERPTAVARMQHLSQGAAFRRMGANTSSSNGHGSSIPAAGHAADVATSTRGPASASPSPTPMPPVMYGTAWKKERTAALVELAVRTGFRGIDTACQPRHYYEPGVGIALRKLLSEGVVSRRDLFLQTKYSPLSAQDPNNTPYDRSAPLRQQVQQSLRVSLQNLGTDYLDSLVLHSPLPTLQDTLEVWREFEAIHRTGTVLRLGISNCYDLATLQALHSAAEVKPSVLQNRFYKDSGYDVALREFCTKNNITYQSFWTLTGNPNIVNSPTVARIAEKHGKTRAQVWYRFVHAQGITFLTGTSSEAHMREDLEVPSIALEEAEIDAIGKLLK